MGAGWPRGTPDAATMASGDDERHVGERASVAKAHPLHPPLDQNAHSSFFCACTASLHLSAKGEKGAELPRARPTQTNRARRAAAKGGSYLVRTAVPPLARRPGIQDWPALGHQVRAPQRPSLGPEAASRPSLCYRQVGIALKAMDEGLAGHAAASGPASVARKRSGRTIARARPRQQAP